MPTLLPRPRLACSIVLAVAALLSACERRRAPEPAPPPVAAAPAPAVQDDVTLAAVKRRGRLDCGVNQGLVGFARRDNQGVWRGFDADLCRAVAAAILGDGERVRFIPVSAEARFDALRRGQFDVLIRNSSFTLGRDANGLQFPAVAYYDGQGVLVRRSLALTSVAELAGARVCVQAGSTSRTNLEEWFAGRALEVEVVPFETADLAREGYGAEQCDALTGDISALASARALLPEPNAHAILSEVIGKEPLGPVVREDDPAFADVVRWTLYALILAEEAGVTAATAPELVDDPAAPPEVRRLLGTEGGFGAALGLDDAWALRAITAVGNYGEVFERNVGRDSPLRLERGLNALWTAEPRGLIYAPPLR